MLPLNVKYGWVKIHNGAVVLFGTPRNYQYGKIPISKRLIYWFKGQPIPMVQQYTAQHMWFYRNFYFGRDCYFL